MYLNTPYILGCSSKPPLDMFCNIFESIDTCSTYWTFGRHNYQAYYNILSTFYLENSTGTCKRIPRKLINLQLYFTDLSHIHSYWPRAGADPIDHQTLRCLNQKPDIIMLYFPHGKVYTIWYVHVYMHTILSSFCC